MTCPRCGHQISDETATSCPNCGAMLATVPTQIFPTPTPDPPPTPAPVPPLAEEEPAQTQTPFAAVAPGSEDTPASDVQPLSQHPGLYGITTTPVDAPQPSDETLMLRQNLRRFKTKTDIKVGRGFLVMGAVATLYALISMGLSLRLFREVGGVFDLYTTVISLFTPGHSLGWVPALFTAAGVWLILAAGLCAMLGGLISLLRGKGRTPAYASLVLMLFVLLFDAIALWQMLAHGMLGDEPMRAILPAVPVYLCEVVYVVAAMLLLARKKAGKKRARQYPLQELANPPAALLEVAGIKDEVATQAAMNQHRAEKRAARAMQKQHKAQQKAARAAEKQADAEMAAVKAAEKQQKADAAAEKAAAKSQQKTADADAAAARAAEMLAEAEQAAARVRQTAASTAPTPNAPVSFPTAEGGANAAGTSPPSAPPLTFPTAGEDEPTKET